MKVDQPGKARKAPIVDAGSRQGADAVCVLDIADDGHRQFAHDVRCDGVQRRWHMKWIGYGLQGVGGVMTIAGLGVFAVGKLVARAASSPTHDDTTEEVLIAAIPV
jgi:hypothetical protein